MIKPTVVILLSDKRSGSTMFQNELCKHAQIQTVTYSPHTYLETHHWLKAAVMLNMDRRTFASGQVYNGYGSRAGARAYMIDCIQKNVPDFVVPVDDRELIFKGWDALCAKFAHPVFFEKSPQFLAQWCSLSLLLEWVHSTEYNVKVIGLTRNPLSVLYSAYELFHTEPEQRQYGWLEIQKNMLAFQSLLPSDSFMHVKYEDIISHPIESFARVCNFIGVSECPDVGASVHSSSVNKWAKDESFTVQLDESVKLIAQHFDYSDLELSNPGKRVPSRMHPFYHGTKNRFELTVVRFRDRVVRPLKLWLKQR